MNKNNVYNWMFTQCKSVCVEKNLDGDISWTDLYHPTSKVVTIFKLIYERKI